MTGGEDATEKDTDSGNDQVGDPEEGVLCPDDCPSRQYQRFSTAVQRYREVFC
jgi:hypothetical protein